MKQSYRVAGMTCQSCVQAVTDSISGLKEVNQVKVDLTSGKVTVESDVAIPKTEIEKLLAAKYVLNGNQTQEYPIREVIPVSKWNQLRPLFLIFLYLVGGVVVFHFESWNFREMGMDFMGLFFLVFSFFKFLDLKGFAGSFSAYDPLARAIPAYGMVYPFLELILGFLFLLGVGIPLAVWGTLLLLSITSLGVVRTLIAKQKIQCACLGTVLKLPMTEATLIENTVMIGMAVLMLGSL